MNQADTTVTDISLMIKKRLRPAAIVSAVLLLVSLVTIFSLPAVYESTANLLIEQPTLQPELVGGAGSQQYVEQRLERTRQQVLTPANISAIIRQHGLYGASATSDISDDLVSMFNQNLTIATEATGVIDPRTMREADLTYGFNIAFRDPSPTAARAVATDLANYFVKSNVDRAQAEAEQTIEFLEREADRLESDLRTREGRLAEFRKLNLSNLPENREQTLFRARDLERDIARVDEEIRAARARRDLIESQLQSTPRNRPVLDENGQTVISGAERLDAAQQELVAALARYSDNHPDVRRLRREIATLTSQADNVGDGSAPSNPVYAQLLSQLESAALDLRELNSRRSSLSADLRQTQAAVFRSPVYEQQYTDLIRDYELVKEQYESMRQRQGAAEVARKAAVSSTLESYTLVGPPLLPTSPVQPDRVAWTLFALLLSALAFLLTAYICDVADRTVRGTNDLMAFRFPIIGQIPKIS